LGIAVHDDGSSLAAVLGRAIEWLPEANEPIVYRQ